MPGPEDLQVSHLDPGHGLHVTCMHSVTSLVPRPSPAPVFDRLQYAKTEGEGLVNLTT